MRELPLYSKCFVCGSENPAGLKVQFVADEDGAYGEFLPDSRWQGYPGVVHGGILTTLLDEVMCKAIFAKGEFAVTAGIEVRFRNPARIGTSLFLKGKAGERRGRLRAAQGEIKDAEGRLIATARGRFYVLSPDQRKEFGF